MTRTGKWIVLALALLVALIATLPQTLAVRRWVFDLLPLLVLLACPLFHRFGHAQHRPGRPDQSSHRRALREESSCSGSSVTP